MTLCASVDFEVDGFALELGVDMVYKLTEWWGIVMASNGSIGGRQA